MAVAGQPWHPPEMHTEDPLAGPRGLTLGLLGGLLSWAMVALAVLLLRRTI